MPKLNQVVLGILFLFGSTQTTFAAMDMAMNLAAVEDWGGQLVFSDLVKQARMPQDSSYNFLPESDLDYQGWPNVLSWRTVMVWDLSGHYPSGDYSLIFSGSGSVQILGSNGNQTFTTCTATSPCKVTINNPALGGLEMRVISNNLTNKIKNISLVMPGYLSIYKQFPFYASFLKRLEGYKTIRFMDFLKTNDNASVNWGDRTTMAYAFQTRGNGAALEYALWICNLLKTSCWLNIPHQASDGYITEFAKKVRDKLDAPLKAYIEYSNEVWNGAFDQYHYAAQKGYEKYLDGNPSFEPLSGNPPDQYIPFGDAVKYYSYQAHHVFDIFRTQFGSQYTTRVETVFNFQSQVGGPWWPNDILGPYQTDPNLNPSGTQIKNYAIAPYIGHNIPNLIGDAGLINSVTVPQILAMLKSAIDQPKLAAPLSTVSISSAKEQVMDAYSSTSAHGVNLVTYEGGQHLVAACKIVNFQCSTEYIDNQVLTDKLVAANRDPQMKDIMLQYFSTLSQFGVKVFNFFEYVGTFGKSGSWGALEFQNQSACISSTQNPLAPKWQALRQQMGLDPCL